MTARRRKLAGAVLYWVTVRDEDTTELLNSWSFRALKEAERKKIEQEAVVDPPGHQTNVAIEALSTSAKPDAIEIPKGRSERLEEVNISQSHHPDGEVWLRKRPQISVPSRI